LSAVTAAPTAAARRVAGHRGSVLRAASVSAGRPGILLEYLDCPRLDELLERRVLDVVRGYLSALSGAQMQRLAAGQRDAQGLVSLVGDGRHRGLLPISRATSSPSLESAWPGCGCCFDFAAAALSAMAAVFFARRSGIAVL